MKMITAQQDESNEIERKQNETQMEWIHLANMLDRISFGVFLILTVSSQSILVLAYKGFVGY